MVIVGLVRTALGDAADRRERRVRRARRNRSPRPASSCCCCASFASGCAALTGVEAISNGVPAFRRPKIQNAQTHPGRDGRDRDRAVQRARRASRSSRRCTTPRMHHLIGFVELRDDRATDPRSAASSPRSPPPRSATTRSCSSSSRRRPRPCCCWRPTPPSTASRCSARCSRSDGYAPKSLAHPRRPPDLLATACWPSRPSRPRHPGRLPGQRDRAHPALHHRRLHLVHPRPDRHGPALAGACCGKEPTEPRRRSGAA